LEFGPTKDWDLFLSHAHEDKADLARPLANVLADHGLRVWFDEHELTIGNSLSRSISYGLANSTKGVVIISPSFVSKKWTVNELTALHALEGPDDQLIWPVWHKVSYADVVRFDPVLADRFALNSDLGVEHLAQEIAGSFFRRRIHQSGDKITVGGMWRGITGRILIEERSGIVQGRYDWHDHLWSGSITGDFWHDVLVFDWGWDPDRR
jgi:hypothetical protein